MSTSKERELQFELAVYRRALEILMINYHKAISPVKRVNYLIVNANIDLYLKRAKTQLELEAERDPVGWW